MPDHTPIIRSKNLPVLNILKPQDLCNFNENPSTPLVDRFDDISILSIGYLDIVAGAYDSLVIAAIVDRAIPKTRQHPFTRGDTVKAMMLNGLGFAERCLYLYPEFFEDIAINRFRGDGVTTNHLNDDILAGRLTRSPSLVPDRALQRDHCRVAEIYLKRPSRIQTLVMIMVLCLFVYVMAEFRRSPNLAGNQQISHDLLNGNYQLIAILILRYAWAPAPLVMLFPVFII